MNLKEAFRYQNKLQQLMEEARDILRDEQNITLTTLTHLRHKIMPEAENETVEECPDTEYAEQIDCVADFLLFLLEQRGVLSAAIRQAKSGMPVDFDSEVSLNADRQSAGRLFQWMASIRSEERIVSGGGFGHRFNAEGNQVRYCCDLKKVRTIHFDRKKIRGMADAMYRKADEISAELDQCLVNTPVAYEPPFAVSATFGEVFDWYLLQS